MAFAERETLRIAASKNQRQLAMQWQILRNQILCRDSPAFFKTLGREIADEAGRFNESNNFVAPYGLMVNFPGDHNITVVKQELPFLKLEVVHYETNNLVRVTKILRTHHFRPEDPCTEDLFFDVGQDGQLYLDNLDPVRCADRILSAANGLFG
jgi:hypothetical protein